MKRLIALLATLVALAFGLVTAPAMADDTTTVTTAAVVVPAVDASPTPSPTKRCFADGSCIPINVKPLTPPKILGKVAVGQKVTGYPGTWKKRPGAWIYDWVVVGATGKLKHISYSQSIKLSASLKGKRIKIVVAAADEKWRGTAESKIYLVR